MDKIGLIAGYGKLPIVFSMAAKRDGKFVVAFCLKGVTGQEIERYVDKAHWFEWGQLQKAVLVLAAERIKKVTMLGKVRKEVFFEGDKKFDDKAKDMLKKAADRKDYSILKSVSKFLAPFGVQVIDPTPYLKELMPPRGILSKRAPTADESGDISYGAEVAKELGRFDIGQTVIVKNKTVIAVEAVEGTDEALKRAGSLCKTGFTAVKVSRPDQDMRFDIPLAGPDTLRVLIESGGSVLALEENRTLLMDRDESVRLANEGRVSLVIID